MGGWTLDLAIVSLEQRWERNTERRKRASTALGPAALVLPVVGVSTGQDATSATAWCVREMRGRRRNGSRVSRGCGRSRF
jgi:hypothetical protein